MSHIVPKIWQIDYTLGLFFSVFSILRALASAELLKYAFCQQENIFAQNFQHFSKKISLSLKTFSILSARKYIFQIFQLCSLPWDDCWHCHLATLICDGFHQSTMDWIQVENIPSPQSPVFVSDQVWINLLSTISEPIWDQIWDSTKQHNGPSDSWGLPESSTYLTCSSLWRWTIARRVLTFGIVSSIVIIFFRGFWLWLGDDICAISFR